MSGQEELNDDLVAVVRQLVADLPPERASIYQFAELKVLPFPEGRQPMFRRHFTELDAALGSFAAAFGRLAEALEADAQTDLAADMRRHEARALLELNRLAFLAAVFDAGVTVPSLASGRRVLQ